MAAIDFHALWTVLWSSLLGGVSVTMLFSVAIVGWVRAMEANRGGLQARASLYGLLAAAALVLFAAAVVFGVSVLLTK